MVVQQHVLNWLYSVLTSVCIISSLLLIFVSLVFLRRSNLQTGTHRLINLRFPQEYHDVNRTYNDVAQALSQYSSLSPRTDVHSTSYPNLLPLEIGLSRPRTNWVVSLPKWCICAAPPPLWHHTGNFPRNNLSISDITMGSSCLSARGAAGLRDPDREHAGATGAAR